LEHFRRDDAALVIPHNFAGPALPRFPTFVHGDAPVLGKRVAVDAVRFISNVSAFAQKSGFRVS
jgi:hypothetical protein